MREHRALPQFVLGGDLVAKVGNDEPIDFRNGRTDILADDMYAYGISSSWSPFLPPHLRDIFPTLIINQPSTRPLFSYVELFRAGSPLILGEERLITIRSPSSYPRSTTSLLCDGIYVGPFGLHGWDYVVVRVGALTETDFQLNRYWEGTFRQGEGRHLGPFSSYSDRPLSISQNHVKPGAKVLDVVKLTGDRNVPRGQRSVIAFLDDPLVERVRLEQNLPEAPTPTESSLPWPAAYDAKGEVKMQQRFAPLHGVHIPGAGRLALQNFEDPRWTDCVVHIGSRTQFTVLWEDLTKATVFTKIETW